MRLEPKQYKDIYKRLPPEIFDLVNSGETTTNLYNIAEKHKLHIDEAGILHDIVMDTAMGVIATKNMQSEIIRELKLNSLDAAAIVRDVDAEVLAPIKESMTNLYKHTNPFMPQTLKHVDEDEEQSINLDRDSLLHEIENPTQSRATKVVPTPAVLLDEEKVLPVSTISDPTPPKPEDMAAKVADDILRASRERMLSAITDQKLSGVVSMKHFVEPEVIEPTPTVKTTPPIDLNVKQPVAPTTSALKPLEIKVAPAVAPVTLPVEKSLPPQQPSPATPVATVPNVEVPKPTPDPYREAI